MLLSHNTQRVIDTMEYFSKLNNIDKVRFGIYILENLHFKTEYNVDNLVKTLNQVLEKLDSNSTKTIINFAKYKNLLFLSAKYMEFNFYEKKKFCIELLFDIYESDFQDKYINQLINDNLDIYNFTYLANVSIK